MTTSLPLSFSPVSFSAISRLPEALPSHCVGKEGIKYPQVYAYSVLL